MRVGFGDERPVPQFAIRVAAPAIRSSVVQERASVGRACRDLHNSSAFPSQTRLALAIGVYIAGFPRSAAAAGASAIKVCLLTIFHAIIALGRLADVVRAHAARAIGSDEATFAVQTIGARGSAAIDVGFLIVFGCIGACRWLAFFRDTDLADTIGVCEAGVKV